ncbi:chorismate--pyruvate lyase family protein [Legionella fairfieldensis]|uniref:chorismate--pyruvate lyase family protein n=1 Tax=Legionella fairfieldensis TaxID=45064 RepID=UPI00048E4071|nr:chorismate lyase [Legionella fairfieldensis]
MKIFPDNLLKTESTLREDLLPWLTHQTSLTDRLKKIRGDVSLKVLNQRWTFPDWWCKFTLDLTVEMIWQREILMYSQETPCWYARTLVPHLTYQTNYSFFEKLDRESLGTLLFGNVNITRKFMLNYSVNNQCLEYYWFPELPGNKEDQYWTRFSGFVLNGLPFYLIEILLPGLVRIMN